MERAELRASDADREQVVELLRGHAADGRLTVEELDERSAQALAARTVGELRALLADLPHQAQPRPAPPPLHAVKQPRLPGKYHFAETWRAPAGPDAAMRDLLRFVAPPLHRHGYDLIERTPYRLVFGRSRRPIWTIAVAVLAFPFGLLALLYKDEERISIDLYPAGNGTLVAANGIAPLAVRRAFAELEG